LFEEASENLDMGLPAARVECGSAHIGGAKSIQLDDGRRRDEWCPPFRNWAALADMS
jgi:hypothetical protein